MKPPLLSSLLLACKVIEDPTPDPVLPADNVTEPAISAVDIPVSIIISPLTPALVPEAMVTSPVLPVALIPDEKDTSPVLEAPTLPEAAAEAIVTAPVSVAAEFAAVLTIRMQKILLTQCVRSY
jgi:hypothetical protein